MVKTTDTAADEFYTGIFGDKKEIGRFQRTETHNFIRKRLARSPDIELDRIGLGKNELVTLLQEKPSTTTGNVGMTKQFMIFAKL